MKYTYANRSLTIQNVHGPDDVSICMIKICHSALVNLFLLISQNCLNCSTFSVIWKKSNISPVYKTWYKVINNYKTVLFGKIFKELIFEYLFKYLSEYKFFSEIYLSQ